MLRRPKRSKIEVVAPKEEEEDMVSLKITVLWNVKLCHGARNSWRSEVS
jgi:hypothetical protein